MTRKEIKELLPIMQAFAEGKDIQIRNITDDGWDDINNDSISLVLFITLAIVKVKDGFPYTPKTTRANYYNSSYSYAICFLECLK